MPNYLRLSDHPLSQQWLAQFRSSEDRALAAQLLNQLKLVSNRKFESDIEKALTDLQTKLQTTIAVYPIIPPIPDEITGYHMFNGGIPKDSDSNSREVGRRRKFGSEDRVGHVLAKLQEQFKRGSGSSNIECVATLTQLKTQGIRHIVLVDDIAGSGKRIANFWKVIPRRVKSLLSLKRYELWIILYAITPLGKETISKAMPNFPLSDHLITVLPEANLKEFLNSELNSLCVKYAKLINRESAGLGYRGSACPIIFEHGCPNNLPIILWDNQKKWKGLYPNRSIPTEMRSCFDEDGTDRMLEALWKANQPKLALSLLDALNHITPLTAEQRMLLTILGLRLRNISEADLAKRLLMNHDEVNNLLGIASKMGLYEKSTSQVTLIGREFVSQFREYFSQVRHSKKLDISPLGYYPTQCEGKLLKLGITDRGNGRTVPMETHNEFL